MRKYILLLCISLIVGEVLAQNEQQSINEIKANRNYLYATGTSATSEEEALDNAQDLLALEIEQWLRSKGTDDMAGYIAKSQDCRSMIRTRRGKLYRVFVFVKKKDVLPYYKEEDVMVVGFVDSANKQEEPNAVDSVYRETPDTIQTQQATSDSSKTSPLQMVEATATDSSYIPTPEERAMMKVQNFTELNDYINRGRECESIVEVGKYSNMPTAGIVYVFIHNRQGEIPACLKVTNGVAINMTSGERDIISRYKGCGAIWIKLKNE